ncbi:TolB family protein [Solwaraspora sp. WMMB335]|uniref:TolB family protein n=1 Tax=Solwaraspora sp. WMMB335 TaxID=3404118 RepID=UPI003B929AA6
MTGLRARLIVLVAVVLMSVLGAGGYVWHVRQSQAQVRAQASPVATRADLASVRAQPHLVFRSTALGTGYGEVAMTPLADPDGPRALTGAPCERVYATRSETICLSAERGLLTVYRAQLLDDEFAPKQNLPLTGIPSRARLSRTGTLAATTSFVAGDSYTNPGEFSTRTVISRTSGEVIGDIEEFPLYVDGAPVTAVDKNLWGVTFADDDRFYATAASGARTWLVSGSISARRVTALREDAECPSLSPDGTRVVFKKRGDLPPGQWRLAVYDLTTGTETLLAENRSVDDQVEWLDDDEVIYGLPRTGGGTAATSDVWRVPADGTGTPQVLVHDAWSPAVIR